MSRILSCAGRGLALLLAGLLANLPAARAADDPDLLARTRVWERTDPGSLPHWLTPEESERLGEIGRTFTQTDPPVLPPRDVAEFERMSAVLVRYPFGISVSLIAAMSQETPVLTLVSGASQENTVRTQYTSGGVNLANCSFLYAPTDSYWTRDYGPWFVQTGGEIAVVDFPYNRPRPNDDDVPWRVAAQMGLEVYGMNVIHTGGNWMSDGYGIAASSDLVVEENPGLTEAQIDQRVLDYLGVSTYHTLPDPNNTYIDHIDCWGKFLDVDKVLVRSVPASHAQFDELEATAQYFANATSSYGTPYRVYRVYTPNDQPYTNSLILNGRVFVPITGSSWDGAALDAYRAAMPGYEVQGFTGSWQSTDALHCRAKGLADPGLLRLKHIPLPAQVAAWQPTELRAEIVACSGQALLADSLKCWFRIDGGAWQALALQPDGAAFHAFLPALAAGQTLDYYLQAADASGRFEQHPFTGRADPHHISAVTLTLPAPQLAIQLTGTSIVLNWPPVPGATHYRVESALDPTQAWLTLDPDATPGWSEPVQPGRRCYRVVALSD